MKNIYQIVLIFTLILEVENVKSQTIQEVQTWLNSTFEYCDEIKSGAFAGKKITEYECNPNSESGYVSIRGNFDRKEIYYNKVMIYGKNKIEIIHNGPFNSEMIEYVELIQMAIEQEEKITLTFSTYPLSMNKDFPSKHIIFSFSSGGELEKFTLNTKEIRNKEYDFSSPIKGSDLIEINNILETIPELPLLNKKGKASNGVFGIGSYLRATLVQIGILKPNAGDLGKIAAGQLTLTERFPTIWK